MKRKGFSARSVRYSVGAMIIALLCAISTPPAEAQNTYYGTGAGASGLGTDDAGFGFNALESEATGSNGNTAIGWQALQNNTTGTSNTASGLLALFSNTTGGANTATGTDALADNITGGSNTATGFQALNFNTGGNENTATGIFALFDNTSGNFNTATGGQALNSNTMGGNNTASGFNALFSNTTGSGNTGTGINALQANNGDQNTADGNSALLSNTTGSANTASGTAALFNNTSGSSNIAVGEGAGENLTTGDNNIDIGNQGVAGEAGTIRIGTQGTETSAFIAGIFNTAMSKSSARAVLIDSSGKLGFQSSSARFKRDIHDMGDASAGLMELRPVSFRYKQDPNGSVQYGLIAEEVQRLYPELVTSGADGKVDGVRYDLLPAMLINEMQKLAREKNAQISALRRQIASQQQQIEALKKKDAQIDALAERMNALESQARLSKPQALVDAAR